MNGSSSETRPGRLAGRGAVVTGASSGIGRAIAVAFAHEGAHLLLVYHRNADGIREVAEEARAAGVEVTWTQADVSAAGSAEALVAEAFERLPSVDVWVNNAGADILTGEGVRQDDEQKLEAVLAVDVRGTIRCCWQVAPRMQAQGHGVILNVSWDQVLSGAPGRSAEIYAAAKGALLAFSKSLARSVAPTLRVNVLAPGWIATAFGDGLPADKQQRIAATIPLGRWGRPEDVARAAVFLASSDAQFLTGSTLLVNGGVVM